MLLFRRYHIFLCWPRLSLLSVLVLSCVRDSTVSLLYPIPLHQQRGLPPYFYVLKHRPVYSPLPDWIGVAHGMDLALVFGAPFKNIPDPFVNAVTKKYSEMDKGMSLYIMRLWTDFAKYG